MQPYFKSFVILCTPLSFCSVKRCFQLILQSRQSYLDLKETAELALTCIAYCLKLYLLFQSSDAFYKSKDIFELKKVSKRQ